MSDKARPSVVSTMFCPAGLLESMLPDCAIIQGPRHAVWGKAEILRRAPHATALILRGGAHERVDAALLQAMPNLLIVANASLGYDNLDTEALAAYGVWGTNEPREFTVPTAEITLGLILATLRRLPESDRFVRAGAWGAYAPGLFDGETLAGSCVGLVGFGKIGQEVAKRLQGFGVEILYYARTRRPADVEARLRARYAPLQDLLAAASVVSMHVPLTPTTRGMVNAEFFHAMRPGAFFINTSRGAVVDEPALVEALQSGRLRGAGLDVFANEPHVPPELPTMENVVLLPHIGGGTHQARTASMANAAENVRLALAGERPRTPVAIPQHPRRPLRSP